MNGKNKNNNPSEMIIYTTEDGLAKIETTFDGDTVWLSIDQMAELFQRDRSVIGKQCETFSKKESFKRKQYGQNLPILPPTEKCMMSIIIILMLSFLSATV